jgi:hypothetical protein
MEVNMQNVNECLDRFDAKTKALRELIEVMSKHNLTFETSLVYENGEEKSEIRIMQDYFQDGEPIVLFSKKDNVMNSIDYVEISRS